MSNQYTTRPDCRQFTSTQVAGLRLMHNDGWSERQLSEFFKLRYSQVQAALYATNCYREVEIKTWAGGRLWRKDARLNELAEIRASIIRCKPNPQYRARMWRESLRYLMPAAIVFGSRDAARESA